MTVIETSTLFEKVCLFKHEIETVEVEAREDNMIVLNITTHYLNLMLSKIKLFVSNTKYTTILNTLSENKISSCEFLKSFLATVQRFQDETLVR